MGILHSHISAKQGCVSWGLEAFGETPRWDTPRGICLLQQEERCPLGAVGHVAMAQHSILSALGHVFTEFSGLEGPQKSKKAVFTCSETL